MSLDKPNRERDRLIGSSEVDTDARNCTALRQSGEFCDAPSAPDMPFPICEKHAAEVFRRTREMMLGALNGSLPPRYPVQLEPKAAERASRVYYVQVGDHIKIGRTTNLRQRMQAYPLNRRLLAHEPGGASTETRRLNDFREYLDLGREWFRPGPALIDHINVLRGELGGEPINLGTAA